MELIQSTPGFLAIKEDWNHLLSLSASHVPFLRHEYLVSWWDTLGGGEWEDGELTILVDRGSDNACQAIAPLFINNGRVMFLGSFEISDYLDLIAPREYLPSFIAALFSSLKGENFPAWQTVDLMNIPENSPTLPIFKEEARKAGYTISEEIIQPAPYLRLPSSWEAYLDSLTKRYQREINKKISHAENYFLPVSWYIVEEIDHLEAEIDAFLKLMANHPEKAVFLSDKMITQIKLSAREAFLAGWLQLAFLQVGDIKAAGYLNFDFNNQIYVYNSGIDPLFENISPGWVLLGYLVQWAIEHGRTGLDFMRGDEPYKYQFGGIDKKILRLQITK